MVYFIINGWISCNNRFKYYSVCQHKLNSCHILHDLISYLHLSLTWFLPSHTVHLDTIKVLLPADTQNNCFIRILQFTLKQLQHYDKGYQQMPLSFVIFLYLHVSSLHVSGFYQPIIRGILSCCLFVATWFM